MSIKKVYPLTTPEEIRTALRKRTVQNSIWKDQAKSGVDCREELFAYIDLMSEDECREFLNSVREAPFIPDMGLMWTEEVANYLMFGDLPSNMRYSMDRCATFGEYVQRSTRIEPIPYRTDYVKKCVDKRYWCLLPLGGTANYYSPSQVLRLAIIFHHSSELAEYIAEAFFIKAADLEDCLKPTVKVPKPLPIKPRQRKTPQKKVVLQVPESACVSIDVPKPAEPEIPKAAEVPKVVEVPKQRRNPVVAAVPRFAAEGRSQLTPELSREIDSYIEAHYSRFGGSDTAQKIADDTGLTRHAICQRVHRINVRKAQESGTNKYAEVHHNSGNVSVPIDVEKREKIFEAIKTRLRGFGGNDKAITLAKEFGVSDGTIYRFARQIRANMATATT